MREYPVSVHNNMSKNSIESHLIDQRYSHVENRGNNLIDYISILRRRKWTIIISPLIVVIIVAWGVSREKLVYETSSTIMIEEFTPNIVPIQGDLSQETSLSTELELIKDYSIIEKVVDKLHLDEKNIKEDNKKAHEGESPVTKKINFITNFVQETKDSIKNKITSIMTSKSEKSATENFNPQELHRYKIIEELRDSLKVRLREGTNLVDISLKGDDPYIIEKELNTLMKIYVKKNLDRKLQETRKAISWLQKEAQSLGEKVVSSEELLQEFREREKFIDFHGNENLNPALRNIHDLNSAYMSSKKDRFFLEKQINNLEKESFLNIDEAALIPIITSNNMIRDLGSRYVELRSKYEILSKNYKEKHPKMLKINSELRQVEKSIIYSLREEHESILEKESKIEKELGILKNNIIQYENNSTNYASLEREFEVNKKLYLNILKKLKEVSITEAVESNGLKLIRKAFVPVRPIPSRKTYKILASVIIGLSIGIGFVFVSEYFDKRFKKVEEVEMDLRIPFLGIIPHHRVHAYETYEPSLLQKPDAFVSEAYRMLRTGIQLSSPDPIKTLLVTSALPAEGKSTTVVNLGSSFAQLGYTVLIVDVDLHHPSIHHHFNLQNELGLTDILLKEVNWNQAIQDTSIVELKIISTGVMNNIPSELLNSRKMKELIRSLREYFDLIIFDASSVLATTDVEILSSEMDKILLVHNPDKETKEPVFEAKNVLERTHTPLLGIIFNNINIEKNTYNYQRFFYDSSSSEPPLKVVNKRDQDTAGPSITPPVESESIPEFPNLDAFPSPSDLANLFAAPRPPRGIWRMAWKRKNVDQRGSRRLVHIGIAAIIVAGLLLVGGMVQRVERGTRRETQEPARTLSSTGAAPLTQTVTTTAELGDETSERRAEDNHPLNRHRKAKADSLAPLVNILRGSPPHTSPGGESSEPTDASDNIQEPLHGRRVVIVQAGDTLEKIIRQAYGRYTNRILSLVQEANPDITNSAAIAVNQRIVLPLYSE